MPSVISEPESVNGLLNNHEVKWAQEIIYQEFNKGQTPEQDKYALIVTGSTANYSSPANAHSSAFLKEVWILFDS